MDGLKQDTALLRALAHHTGLSPSALAREAGLADTTISRPFNGKAQTRLSSPTLEKLRARFPNFPGWSSGSTTPNDVDDDLVQIAEIDLRYGAGGAFLDESSIEISQRQFSRAWLRSITTSPPSLLFWSRAKGNSMSPTIEDGEIVLGDRSQTRPEYDDLIWACALGEIGMIKRLRVRAEHVKILSDNPLVPEDVAHPDDNLRIVGRIIAVVRNL